MKPVLEVCAGCIESVLAAKRGGAYRVELCSGLDEGGITPSLGFLRAALAVEGIKKHILIRPRGGDFLYTQAELDVIVEDIRIAVENGVDGIVVGALNADGGVDMEAMQRFMQAADGCPVTFHRAFDLCASPHQALEDVISLGCRRVLTSGTASTAEAGIPMLAELVKQTEGRISIMPGCGVGPRNASKILRETGAHEIHASSRALQGSLMRFRHEGVGMGKEGVDEYARMVTSEEIVRQIVESF